MFQSGYSRAISADISAIERRLRALKRRLERAVGSSKWQSADDIRDAVASALGGVGDRLRRGADAVTAKLGSEAAKVGNTALNRLADSVEHRPLVTLAVAAGVGFLMGLARHRH